MGACAPVGNGQLVSECPSFQTPPFLEEEAQSRNMSCLAMSWKKQKYGHVSRQDFKL
jgi:hypothetical protein